MRKSVIEQSRDFIKLCKSKDTWVFKKGEVKKSIRDYLVSVETMFSPYNGIFVIKKSTDTKYKSIKDNIYNILQNMGGVIGGDFALNYYLGKNKFLNEYVIYIKQTQFSSFIGDDKKIQVHFKQAKTKRDSIKIDIKGTKLDIESPLSFIVNNIKDMGEKPEFIEFVLKQQFESTEILQAILSKYKISGLSKLAIMYKNFKREGQYKIIKSVIEESGKKLDRRNNKVKDLIKPKIKEKPKKVNFDNLF